MSFPLDMSINRGLDSNGSVSSLPTIKRSDNNRIALKNSDDAEYPRNEVVWQIFGPDVGPVINDFSCAVQSRILLHGRLYVTSCHLLFYSNIFSFEKIVRIPFTHVRGVSRESTALIIPNAIAITTSKSTYIFRSFWDREEAFFVIKNAHRMSHGLAPLESYLFTQSVDEEDDDEESEDTISGSNRNLITGFEASNIVDTSSEPSQVHDLHVWIPPSTMPYDSEEDAERIRHASDADEWQEDGSLSLSQSQLETQIGDKPGLALMRRSESMEKGFVSSIKALERDSEGSKSVMMDVTVNGLGYEPTEALNKYFELYLSENAAYGLVAFHLSQGDSDVAITKWDGDNNGWRTRELRYVHPYSGPMGGMSTCRTVKAQRYRSFGEFGLILQTTTYLEDVPMSDYFQLVDRCIVRPSGPNQLTAHVVMEIKFIKSTMVRGIIEQRSLSESKEVWQKFFEMVKNSLSIPPALSPNRMIRKAQPLNQPEPTPERNHEQQTTEKPPKIPLENTRIHANDPNPPRLKRKREGTAKMACALFCIALPWLLLSIIACIELFKHRILRAEMKGLMNGIELVLEETGGAYVQEGYSEHLNEKMVELIVDTYARNRFLTRYALLRR